MPEPLKPEPTPAEPIVKPVTPETEPVVKPVSRRAIRERQQNARRVFLDPSSPSIRSIVRVVLVTLILLFIAGSVQTIIYSLSGLFFLIVLAIFFAYLLDPLVRLMSGPVNLRGSQGTIPRWLAICIAYVLVFTLIGAFVATIAPRIVDQAKELGANIPAYTTAFRDRIRDINQRFDRLRVPDEVQSEMNKKITDVGGEITTTVGNFLIFALTYLPWLILVPILAFFFLKDVNQFRLLVLRVFPAGRWRARAELVMSDVSATLAAYTRAQLISCFIIGTECTIGFYIIGLKYALLLGIIAGIFEFVPLIGPITIGVIVILTAGSGDRPWNALYVAIFLILIRIVHDYVAYPRIIRGGIHLHPLAIILSVLAGEQIAGIPGVFLSIPIVAILSVLYRHILEHQGQSRGLLTGVIKDAEAAAEEII